MHPRVPFDSPFAAPSNILQPSAVVCLLFPKCSCTTSSLISNTVAPVIEKKLTVQDKLRYIGGIAKTIWDVQEPQTAQSSNRGQPLHETLFSVSGVMSTYWVKGWLYDEEIEMNEQSIIKTLTVGMQVRNMCGIAYS